MNNNKHFLKDLDIDFIENMLEEIPANIYFKDKEAKYVFVSHYWKHVNTDDIRGKTDLEVRKDKENAKKAYESDLEVIKTGIGKRYTIKIDVDNDVEYLEIIKKPVFDKEKNVIGIVGLINDVTKRVIQEKQLEFLATQDQMTGLYNRACLDMLYKNENKEDLYPISILVADCNHLKMINDNYGHLVGDEYIKKSASILKIVLPDYSYIFRIGGDEFLAFIPKTTSKEIEQYIEKMNSLAKSIKIKDEHLSIAFGYEVVNKYKKDFTKNIENADKKMYIKKEKMHNE